MALCCFKPRNKRFPGRNKFFLKNSNLLFEQLIALFDRKSNPIRMYSEKELKKATCNFRQDHILQSHVFYTLYKGSHENRDILVKRYFGDVSMSVEQGINEIVMLSQINHKNVVKLLGCCLETQYPILVYDYCFNGNLSCRVYSSTRDRWPLSWKSRLKIATEVANAITYLHTFTSRPIIHRVVRPESILLDQQDVAKLSDFGFSILAPFGKTHVEGTIFQCFAYAAPDTFTTGRSSVKTDVYSFGVILLVILTGRRAHDIQLEGHSLAHHAKCLLQKHCFHDLVDSSIKVGESAVDQQMQQFVKLAIRCINEIEDQRPTMMEVAKELTQITRLARPH